MLSRLAARAAQAKTDTTQQLIIFRLQGEWFALPIAAAFKVIPLGSVYGLASQGGPGLTRYLDRDVIVVDVRHRIFGEPPHSQALPDPESAPPVARKGLLGDRYLLIVQHGATRDLMGLPIDTQPSLRRVSPSAFTPVPPTFLNDGKIRCVAALIKAEANHPPTFLLNLDKLVQPA